MPGILFRNSLGLYMSSLANSIKYFIVLFAMIALSFSAHAATVAKTKKSKKRVIIENIIPTDRFIKGEKACIYDEQNTEVACGKIVHIKEAGDKAYMKLSKKKIRRVKKGMRVFAIEPMPSDDTY